MENLNDSGYEIIKLCKKRSSSDIDNASSNPNKRPSSKVPFILQVKKHRIDVQKTSLKISEGENRISNVKTDSSVFSSYDKLPKKKTLNQNSIHIILKSVSQDNQPTGSATPKLLVSTNRESQNSKLLVTPKNSKVSVLPHYIVGKLVQKRKPVGSCTDAKTTPTITNSNKVLVNKEKFSILSVKPCSSVNDTLESRSLTTDEDSISLLSDNEKHENSEESKTTNKSELSLTYKSFNELANENNVIIDKNPQMFENKTFISLKNIEALNPNEYLNQFKGVFIKSTDNRKSLIENTILNHKEMFSLTSNEDDSNSNETQEFNNSCNENEFKNVEQFSIETNISEDDSSINFEGFKDSSKKISLFSQTILREKLKNEFGNFNEVDDVDSNSLYGLESNDVKTDSENDLKNDLNSFDKEDNKKENSAVILSSIDNVNLNSSESTNSSILSNGTSTNDCVSFSGTNSFPANGMKSEQERLKEDPEFSESLNDSSSFGHKIAGSRYNIDDINKENLNKTLENEKMDFNWDMYLENIHLEGVPPTAFLHVEKSFDTGIRVGQCVEIVCEEFETIFYWPAKIVSAFSTLLRLKYIGFKSSDIWKDISEGKLFKVGHCKKENIAMKMPDNVKGALDEDELSTFLNDLQLNLLSSPPSEALSLLDEPYTIVKKIIPDMKVELLNKTNPLTGEIFKVVENTDGYLFLESLCPESQNKIACAHFRDKNLKPLNWIKNQYGYSSYSCCDENFFSLSKQEHIDSLLHLNFHESLNYPSDVFFMPNFITLRHSLECGAYLEVVHPSTPTKIFVAYISKILNETHFELTIPNNLTWITSVDDPFLLKPRFAHDNGMKLMLNENEHFSWDNIDQLQFQSKVVKLLNDDINEYQSAEELGFSVNKKLEIINPLDSKEMVCATVVKVMHHLISVKFDSDLLSDVYIYSAESTNLFPIGWSQNNNFPLRIPSDYNLYCNTPSLEMESMESSSEFNETTKSDDDDEDSLSSVSSFTSPQESMWCPRLYINHCCQCGPLLSKSKVAKQSQCVGPGATQMVLKEVVAKTIKAAYIPTRVLKEISRIEPLNSNWHLVNMKAKLKRYIFKSPVPIASTSSDVEPFIIELTKVLQACPNLWSFSQTTNQCPYGCHPPLSSSTVNLNGSNIKCKLTNNSQIHFSNYLNQKEKKSGQNRLFMSMKPSMPQLYPKENQNDEMKNRFDELDFDDYMEVDSSEGVLISASDEEGSVKSSRPNSPPLCVKAKDSRNKEKDFLEFQRSKLKYFDSKLFRRENGLTPAFVASDPLYWTVHDVEQYMLSQPDISHHAVKMKDQEVDGRALLLLNLPSLIEHLDLPHSSAVVLAKHICKVKLAHFVNFSHTWKV